MEVNLKQEHVERLNRLAQESGRGTDDLIEEAIENLLEYRAWFRAQVQRGLADVEEGRFVESEEVRARIDRILKA